MISSTLIRMKLCLILLSAVLLHTEAQVQHRDLALSLCSETEKQKIMGLDGEEMWHADFRQGRGVITLPDFADPFSFPDAYAGAVSQQTFCKQSLDICKEAYGNPPEPKIAPKLSIYPKSDVRLGSKNTVICYITGFYPPEITVSWYRGDEDVTNQATFSRYHLTSDRTFNLVSHLSFTPVHGDTYSCIVRHTALNGPLGKVWGVWVNPKLVPSVVPTVVLGVGVGFGVLGVAVGTFLLVKGRRYN